MRSSDIRRLRGSPWGHTFEPDDIMDVFHECGPIDSVYHMANFNLSWFVEKCFNNQQGKPLKLEAFQQVALDLLWYKKFPMFLATRGAGKTFLLALFALIKAILVPGSKIVIVGSGFRQAKLVFQYIEQLYNASPLIQEAACMGGGPKYGSDAATLKVGLSLISAIPIGDGQKIRGMRASTLIADEFASIPEDIFDIVIEPFTAVHMNPAERAAQARFTARLRTIGADEKLIETIDATQGFGNQVIISGTPSYKHNHFYKRWCVYMAFIRSRGDSIKLKHALEEMHLQTTGRLEEIDPDDVSHAEKSWGHYAVFQLPYTALPYGFMEEDIIRKARANYPYHRFAMEYLAEFPDDTDGFIKRSWVESATPKGPDDIPVTIELYGDPRATYVMGIDPARFNDNLGIVVLKITERGLELVYCQAWDKTEYGKSAKKIREIVKRFHIAYIAMDTGGGGEQVREWLCKKVDGVSPEDFIWVIPDQMEKFTDNKSNLSAPGKKIIEMVDFTPTWISQAAHGIESNVRQGHILFPDRGDADKVYNQYMNHFNRDGVTDGEKDALQKDLWGVDEWEAEQISEKTGKKTQRSFGVQQNIDECINETCAISRMVSPKGTESFELPKLAEQPEGLDMRRRDRWSALMLVNYAAKVYMGTGHEPSSSIGVSPISMHRQNYTSRGRRQRGSATW